MSEDDKTRSRAQQRPTEHQREWPKLVDLSSAVDFVGHQFSVALSQTLRLSAPHHHSAECVCVFTVVLNKFYSVADGAHG